MNGLNYGAIGSISPSKGGIIPPSKILVATSQNVSIIKPLSTGILPAAIPSTSRSVTVNPIASEQVVNTIENQTSMPKPVIISPSRIVQPSPVTTTLNREPIVPISPLRSGPVQYGNIIAGSSLPGGIERINSTQTFGQIIPVRPIGGSSTAIPLSPIISGQAAQRGQISSPNPIPVVPLPAVSFGSNSVGSSINLAGLTNPQVGKTGGSISAPIKLNFTQLQPGQIQPLSRSLIDMGTGPSTPETSRFFVSQSPGGLFTGIPSISSAPSQAPIDETNKEEELKLDQSLFSFNGALPSSNPMMSLLVSPETLPSFINQLPTSGTDFIRGSPGINTPPITKNVASITTIVPQSTDQGIMQIIAEIDPTKLDSGPKGGYTVVEIKSFLQRLGLPVKQSNKDNRAKLLQFINERRIN